MTMRIHKAEDRGTVLHYCIHLDETKTLDDGSPDPDWCVEYEWSKEPPEGVSATAHQKSILREMKLLAAEELGKLTAIEPVALAVEGSVL
jgi:hypothetical protein